MPSENQVSSPNDQVPSVPSDIQGFSPSDTKASSVPSATQLSSSSDIQVSEQEACHDECAISLISSDSHMNANQCNDSKPQTVSDECDSKVTSKESHSSIKLLSLNICGLKSKLKMPNFEEYIANIHIIALGESNISMSDDIDVNGFKVIETLCNKRGVGRISLLARNDIAPHVTVIHQSKDIVIWFKLANYSTKLIFGAMYIPPEYSPHTDISIFDVIEQDVLELKSTYDCDLCIFGDANARTGELDDFVLIDRYQVKGTNPDQEDIIQECCLNEEDLNSLNVNLKRTSQDGKVNKYGRRLLDLCQILNLFIVNGRAGEDSGIGKLTCKK